MVRTLPWFSGSQKAASARGDGQMEVSQGKSARGARRVDRIAKAAYSQRPLAIKPRKKRWEGLG